MTFHEPILDYLSSILFLGNSLLDYLVFLFLFVVSMVVLELIRRVLIRRLIYLQRLESKRVVRILLTTMRNYLSFSLSFVLSLYLASLHLEFTITIESFLRLLLFGVIGWLLLKLGLDLLDAILEYQRSIEDRNIHILEFFRLLARGLIIIITFLWVLSNLGVNVASFLASLGIVSLAIAFALNEIISDIFASVVIFIDRPFEIGDVIRIDGQTGTVEKVGIRSTKIRSVDGHLIVSSNRELTSKKIHNFKKMDHRRVTITLQLHQGTPVTLLQAVPGIVEEVITAQDLLQFDKINLKSISDYSFDYELVYFVTSRDFLTHVRGKHQMLIDLLKRFDETDIMLPYPTQTIILEE